MLGTKRRREAYPFMFGRDPNGKLSMRTTSLARDGGNGEHGTSRAPEGSVAKSRHGRRRPGVAVPSGRQAGWNSSCSPMAATVSASALAPIPNAHCRARLRHREQYARRGRSAHRGKAQSTTRLTYSRAKTWPPLLSDERCNRAVTVYLIALASSFIWRPLRNGALNDSPFSDQPPASCRINAKALPLQGRLPKICSMT